MANTIGRSPHFSSGVKFTYEVDIEVNQKPEMAANFWIELKSQ